MELTRRDFLAGAVAMAAAGGDCATVRGGRGSYSVAILGDTHKKMLDDCTKLLRKPYPAGLPFLTVVGNHDFRGKESEASRPRLYETLSRRRAIVLSGHTHTTDFYRHENRFGGFSEFIVNSVWAKPEQATAEPVYDKVCAYMTDGLAAVQGGRRQSSRRGAF